MLALTSTLSVLPDRVRSEMPELMADHTVEVTVVLPVVVCMSKRQAVKLPAGTVRLSVPTNVVTSVTC